MSSNTRNALLKFAGQIAMNLAILFGIALVFVAVGGEWTLKAFGRAAFWSGGLGLVEGFISMMGGWLSTSSFPFQYGASATEETGAERAKAAQDVKIRGEGHVIVIGSAGIIMIILSAVLARL